MDNSNSENKVNKRIVLLIANVGAFLTPFMSSSVNIALPTISKEFAMSAVMQNWVATAYLLSAAIFVVPFGRIADIYGRKKIYLYGVIIITISSALCAASHTSLLLIIFRVLQGIGSAMLFGTGVAILTSVYPAGERGRALGINVGVTYVGLSVGPIFGGVLTHHFSWRSIFLAIVPLGIIVIILLVWKLKQEWLEAAGEKIDYVGALIYGAALLGIMSGLSLIHVRWGIWLMILGVFGIVTFGIYEGRLENPILNIKLFRNNKIFVFSSLAALVNYSATFAVAYLLSIYLQDIKGLNPKNAGYVLIAQPIVQAIFSPFTGWFSDKIETRKIASSGMSLTAIGLLLLIFINESTSLIYIIVSLCILGFGFALFSSPNTNAIMSSVEKQFYGVASGVLGTMRLTGQALSMGITALVISLYIGGSQITREHHPYFIEIFRTTFIILTVFCFAGIFASLARGKMRKLDGK